MPSLRIAQIRDLEDLVRLRVLMQTEVHQFDGPYARTAYPEVLRQYFSQALADSSYIGALAEEDGKVIATAGLCVYRKPPSINGKTGLIGYIVNVYTDREFRRRGLAGKLIDLLIDKSRALGVDRLQLGATESGKRVYERIGFKIPPFPQLEMRL